MTADALVQHTVSIFTKMSALAASHQAVNLSQGFPDFEGPAELKRIFEDEIRNGWNQYVMPFGLPDTRDAVAGYYEHHYRLQFDPGDEITITHGATEALFNSITGLFNPGDEVIVFEPFYDIYIPDLKIAGCQIVSIPLDLSGRRIPVSRLDDVRTDRTRGIILNLPHNPTGFIPSAENLRELADWCVTNDVIVISDEVYEQLVFDDHQHVPTASLPGMRDRTVTISSIGKTFSFTGWKVGWTCAPPALTKGIRASHQCTTFSTIPASQKAAAAALRLSDHYFSEFRSMYAAKRKRLLDGLRGTGFSPTPPDGTYFFVAEYGALSTLDDIRFTEQLVTEIGLALIPTSVFYLHTPDVPTVRFCFAKTDEVLDQAIERLQRL